ncbi:HNH endonuclease [Salmonirosea aquatica]|uniref:HNH endonuclease n=1 Tax=Salmonirosea aquatica TaxID=2654236 RepID=A0A7C9BJF1_9BACT|nr:HNH endonuclease [Cytophagaceae bacterium SJW1-29]
MSRYIADAIRQEVAVRAGFRCEYCQIHQDDAFYPFQIDHIVSRKHGGQTLLDNLALACFPCNVNKSSDVGTILLPQQIFIRLFNPRLDSWNEHFSVESGRLYAKTTIGEATIKVLKMNEIERIIERS